MFDLDGTLTRRDSYVAFLFGYLRQRPTRWARVLHLPFAVIASKMGLRDNEWLKVVFLKAIMGGDTGADICAWTERFVEELVAGGLYRKAVERMEQHRRDGYHLVLVTASPDIYVRCLAKRLGFHDVICTQVTWGNDGRLRGDISGRNCYGPEKRRRVEEWLVTTPFAHVDIVYSDHASDLPFLTSGRRRVAVNPRRWLRSQASKHSLIVERWGNS